MKEPNPETTQAPLEDQLRRAVCTRGQSEKHPRFRSGDPNTRLGRTDPKSFLKERGFPSYLLGTSSKLDASRSVSVLARVLYLTPGLFCPAADSACLNACLGHTSGRMSLPDSYTARDKRAAFYLAHQPAFLERLKAELHLLKADAMLRGLTPAVRLNGASDIAWEHRHRELFEEFQDLQFYDYTKIFPRVMRSLRGSQSGRPWPKNYQLTYSAGSDDTLARRVLDSGGTVAVVFHPSLPERWLGSKVVDGDKHDARFLDESGSIIGLKAKGIARIDVSGFTRRPCPDCGPDVELDFVFAQRANGRISSRHRCGQCESELRESVRDHHHHLSEPGHVQRRSL